VATGSTLPDVIPRVNGGTAGGSLAWNADGSGFF
jgi:prolyl oligopeptidase